MEKFREKLQLRVTWMSCIIIAVAVINFALLFSRNHLPAIPDFIRGFQTGIFAGIELFLVYYLIKYLTAMNKEEALKKIYIEETDERMVLIMQMTGSLGIHISLIGLGIGALIAGFFNTTVFFSLLGALAFIAHVKFLLLTIYSKKL